MRPLDLTCEVFVKGTSQSNFLHRKRGSGESDILEKGVNDTAASAVSWILQLCNDLGFLSLLFRQLFAFAFINIMFVNSSFNNTDYYSNTSPNVLEKVELT